MNFRVEGRSLEGTNEVLTIAARSSKEIFSNPEKHGFTKLYKVTAISNRRSHGEDRDAKYT